MGLKYYYNPYRTYRDYFHRNVLLGNHPRVLTFELTNHCNLDCAMCPRRHMKRKVGFMNVDLFKEAVAQVRGYNNWIYLHNFGESLYHPKLEEIINHCHENGMETFLSTNATILDDDRCRMLLNSKLDNIILCLDGATQEVYQAIRHGGDFEEVSGNIDNFLRLKKGMSGNGLKTFVQIIKMKATDEELSRVKEKWSGLADQMLLKRFSTWADQVESITRLASPEHLCYPQRSVRHPCIRLWKDLTVLWNGDVTLCCMDFDGTAVLGNLREKSLKQIWNSEKLREMRRDQIENRYENPLCRNCLEWTGYPADRSFPFSRKVLHRPWRHIINRTYVDEAI